MDIVPHKLRKGDTIAFVSPGLRPEGRPFALVARAKEYIESQGYHVRIILEKTLSNDLEQRILQRCEELHAAFRDPEVKAILCTLGGSANELLSRLDYDLIRSNPKIFCGFSGITVLHYAIFSQTGLRTFYGPVALMDFGEPPKPLDFTVNHFFHVLQTTGHAAIGAFPRSSMWATSLVDFMGDPPQPRYLLPSPSWLWLRHGKAKGRIFGGCLSPMTQILGTKYWPDYEGKILLVETPVGPGLTNPYPLTSVASYITDLANVGVLEKISGLVVGRPYRYDDEQWKQFNQIIVDRCHRTKFPILANVDIGHTSPMLTIPLGAMVGLDSEKDSFELLEAAVIEEEK